MISFQQIHDPDSEGGRLLLEQARGVFRRAFPHEPEGIDRIARLLDKRASLDFDPLLLVALGDKRTVTGLAFVFFFPSIRMGYLQYIASDPDIRGRGIGGALYEAIRELVIARHGKAMLLDIPPVDADAIDEPERLALNRKRLDFYERYGARIIENTMWDRQPNARNAGYLTHLLYDPLGRGGRLRRAEARRVARSILVAQYGYEAADPFVRSIVRSFAEDPVAMRPTAAPAPRPLPGKLRRITPIKMVVTDGHEIHHLKERGYVERPVRVRQILKGLAELPIERVPIRKFPDKHLTAVHDPKFVSYLKAVCLRLGPKAIVYPEVFPIRRPDRAPQALEDRAGYFCADTFTPLTHNAYPAARTAVDVALTAADLIRTGERFAYALCRPPGHHAERRIYGGFCYLNNSAIAAQYLAADGKVALLDIDYHHGNGAQDIFYARNDVLTLSIHGHPRSAYPNFSGYADERGEGPGIGFNRNWPLDPPIDDAQYLRVLEEPLAMIRRFRPRYLVVSLGFDIMQGDPTGAFSITTNGLRRIAEAIGKLRLQTLIVQEGGYAVRNLRVGAQAFFSALGTTWYAD